jgi:hypothetical protein
MLLYVLCFFLTACGDASTAQTLQAVTSWAATAHLVGDAWRAHAAPQAYAVQTLRYARRQLHTQLRTLQSHPPSAPAEARAALADHLQRLEHTVRQMLTAVRQEDAAALGHWLTQLAREQEAMAPLLAQSDVQG